MPIWIELHGSYATIAMLAIENCVLDSLFDYGCVRHGLRFVFPVPICLLARRGADLTVIANTDDTARRQYI